MRKGLRLASLSFVAAFAVAGCTGAGTPDTTAGDSGSETTGATSEFTCSEISWWVPPQLATVEESAAMLESTIAQFTADTGVEVDLEVVPWGDLYNKILTAVTSGVGPDVLNIGNTWAAPLQATGAFLPFEGDAAAAVGGLDKFTPALLETGGVPGQGITSLPLYSASYGLYYNKAMFAEAGLEPPTTWEEFIEVGKALTNPAENQWGAVLIGASNPIMMHYAWIFGSQEGAQWYDGETPVLDDDAIVRGMMRIVDLVQTHKIANPSSAEYEDSVGQTEFAAGRVGMYMAPSRDAQIQGLGMSENDYGMVPVPAPAGGQQISTFVAGTNISIFANSECQAESLALVKLVTDVEAQEQLNKAISFIPSHKDARVLFTEDADKAATYADILANRSNVLPLTESSGAFQNALGNAIQSLLQKAATSGNVTEADVREALDRAAQEIAAAS